jgi:hypothetical protein
MATRTSRTGGAPDEQLIEQIRRARDNAYRRGDPLPGRQALQASTGRGETEVKNALTIAKTRQRQAASPQLGTPPANSGPPYTSSASMPGETTPAPGAIVVNPGSPEQPQSTPPEGLPWATRAITWTGFAFGAAISIAANWFHTWLPAATDGPPGLAPQIGAAVWPVALIFAVEVLARVRWPRGAWWGIPRYLGTGIVAAGSWLISYGDVRDVLLAWHYQPAAAAFGPLVLDGLMIVCALALLANSRARAGDPRSEPSPADPQPPPQPGTRPAPTPTLEPRRQPRTSHPENTPDPGVQPSQNGTPLRKKSPEATPVVRNSPR